MACGPENYGVRYIHSRDIKIGRGTLKMLEESSRFRMTRVTMQITVRS